MNTNIYDHAFGILMNQDVKHHKMTWLKSLQKGGVKGVHKVIPIETEWLSVLSAINTSGDHIPNYYIFNGIRKLKDYTIFCRTQAMLGIQKKGWMDSTHFLLWID